MNQEDKLGEEIRSVVRGEGDDGIVGRSVGVISTRRSSPLRASFDRYENSCIRREQG
jgi:hypothetical protein